MIHEREIIETRDVIMAFFKRATNNDLMQLRNNPVETLRKEGIPVLNRFNTSNLNELSRYVKKLIRNVQDSVKEWRDCAGCKVALKTIFLALSTMGQAWLIEHLNLNEVIKACADFFNGQINEITRYLGSLGLSKAEYSYFEIDNLIEKLCSKYGYCV